MWSLRSKVKPTLRQQIIAILTALLFGLLAFTIDAHAEHQPLPLSQSQTAPVATSQHSP